MTPPLCYRPLEGAEVERPLFAHFIRRQVVLNCWRREGGAWVIREDPFVDTWSEQDYQQLLQQLKNTIATGGVVYGAFVQGQLKGFAAVEPGIFGGEQGYVDLSELHVSQDWRGRGVGTALFLRAMAWAKAMGGRKLYISAHSAVETQAFYQKMGCRDAQVCHLGHVAKEPFDRQLECLL